MAGIPTVKIGLPDEQKDFLARHKLFFERLPNLQSACEVAFIRTSDSSELPDRVIFYLGRSCVEDFCEILLLCGNGYGIGGLRLLRGLYERAVTAYYIHLHPDAAEDYWDYYWVTTHKESQAILNTYGEEFLKTLSAEKPEEIDKQFARVRERFLVSKCKKCGTKRLNHTWSKLDFVSMARQTGHLGTLIVPAYYRPLKHTHSSSAAIASRVGGTEDEITSLDGPQRDEADSCLLLVHNILLNILMLQRVHFGLNALDDPLWKCDQDFSDIWGGESLQKPKE